MIPANMYLLKVNNRNTITRREIYSKLKIKTPDDIAVFIVNFEHVSHPFLGFLLLTLSRKMPAGDTLCIRQIFRTIFF